MRVLLLGAGASIKANYPPAAKLLPCVESYVSSSRDVIRKDCWNKWAEFRDSKEAEVLRSLLNTENPEIALSALDLLDKAREDHLTRRASERLRSRALWDVYAIRLNLIKCLNDFFMWKSIQEASNPDEREYLRSFFERTQLKQGDTVITLNWDSVAERTLGEMGLWNPSDGYGISKNLKRHTPLIGKPGVALDDESPIPPSPENAVIAEEYREIESDDECPLQPSPVKVLKLHGSAGWMRQDGLVDSIFFDTVFLHSLFHAESQGRRSTFSDRDFKPYYQFDLSGNDTNPKPVMVVPTFLKSVPEGADMQRIWHLAEESLAKAEVVEVVGYSLPESDSAMRVLLNQLRFRTEAGDVHVHVYDPDKKTRERWNDFLGASISTYAKLE